KEQVFQCRRNKIKIFSQFSFKTPKFCRRCVLPGNCFTVGARNSNFLFDRISKLFIIAAYRIVLSVLKILFPAYLVIINFSFVQPGAVISYVLKEIIEQ